MILRYDQIMQSAIANMAALQDKVTDFNEGSIIHTILDTVSRIAERAYIAIRQSYNEMLSSIPYSLFGFERKAGRAATGKVKFLLKEAQNYNITIPKGVKLSGGGLSFTTSESSVIVAGSKQSQRVAATCDVTGEVGNVPKGTIESIDTIFDSCIYGILQEDNFTGGMDEETDSDFEARFKTYLAGLSGTNCYAIKSAVLNIEGVQSVATQNHKPPKDDLYNMSIYVDDGAGGETSEDMLDKVYKVLCGDGTKENQGYLAPGVNIIVLPPKVIKIDFSAVITIKDISVAEAKRQVEDSVKEYIKSLSIGYSFIGAECIARIMELPCIKDVRVNSPIDNVAIDISQIAKVGDISLEFMEE